MHTASVGEANVHRTLRRLHSQQLRVPFRIFRRFTPWPSSGGLDDDAVLGAGTEAGFNLCCWTDASIDLPGKAMAYQSEVAAGGKVPLGYLMKNSDGGRRE